MHTLRPYQSDLIEGLRHSFVSNRRVMVQLPTGGGKTVLFTDVVDRFVKQGKRVLMFVHRKELVNQMADKLYQSMIPFNAIVAGKRTRSTCPVQLGTVQTLSRRDISALPTYDLIVCDEAHHSTAGTYRNLYNAWPESYVLGVSATPCRLDGTGFDDLFDDLICGPSVKQLIEWGYLSEFTVYASPVPVNASKMRKRGGEFRSEDMNNFANAQMQSGDVVKTYLKHGIGKTGICFGVNKRHCEMIRDAYREEGIAADVIDSDTPDDVRRRLLKDLKNRSLNMLINCEIFTEGFDLPAIDIVQMARPTLSLSLHLQMIGRGLRVSEGKERALIFDHAGNVKRHGRPDIELEWDLSGVKKKERKPVDIRIRKEVQESNEPDETYLNDSTALDETFASVKSGAFDPHLIDLNKLATGAEIASQPDKDMSLPTWVATALSFKEYADSRGWKKASVLYRMHEMVENRPLNYEERVIACRMLGYKPGFQYKMNDFLAEKSKSLTTT